MTNIDHQNETFFPDTLSLEKVSHYLSFTYNLTVDERAVPSFLLERNIGITALFFDSVQIKLAKQINPKDGELVTTPSPIDFDHVSLFDQDLFINKKNLLIKDGTWDLTPSTENIETAKRYQFDETLSPKDLFTDWQGILLSQTHKRGETNFVLPLEKTEFPRHEEALVNEVIAEEMVNLGYTPVDVESNPNLLPEPTRINAWVRDCLLSSNPSEKTQPMTSLPVRSKVVVKKCAIDEVMQVKTKRKSTHNESTYLLIIRSLINLVISIYIKSGMEESESLISIKKSIHKHIPNGHKLTKKTSDKVIQEAFDEY